MEKTRKILLFFVLLALCLGGCAKTENAPRLVTRIEVTAYREEDTLHRVYTTPEKMESILYYLRTLKKERQADTNPEKLKGDYFVICLGFSDGDSRVYYQAVNRYLSIDAHRWFAIDPERAEKLYPLLDMMPGDPKYAIANRP